MLSFVEHSSGELECPEVVDVATQERIAGDDNVGVGDLLEKRGAVSAFEHERFELGRKLLRFALPIRHERSRANDQGGARLDEVSPYLLGAEKREGLHGF